MSTAASTARSYDEVPYISVAIPPSHPDRISVVARLFGLPAPDTRQARILELGCASGGNLLPMAETLPESTFLGIDLSGRQVQMGRQMIAAAELTNVTIEQQDILELGAELGQFDYIIAHGVYSWVPAAVRQKILDLCRQLLTPYGVAYISYNTYPGWRFHKEVRELMLYGTRRIVDPRVRVRQSRMLLESLSQSIPVGEQSLGAVFQSHLEALRKLADPFLLHDHLEAVNEPVYFHEFTSAAESAGLQFLGEAVLGEMYTGRFPPQVQENLKRLSQNILDVEQYIDFFSNRMLRRTLLCKKEVGIDRNLTGDRAKSLYLSADIRADAPHADLETDSPLAFQSAAGHSVTSTEPAMKAALTYLGKIWPNFVQFEDLLVAVRKQVKIAADAPKSALAESVGGGLLHGAAGGLIDLRTQAPSLTTEISERPQTSPLVRAQAGLTNLVANRRHEVVSLNDLGRFVLSRADGTQSVEALTQSLQAAVQAGNMQIKSAAEDARPTGSPDQYAKQCVTQALADAARNALLVA